MWIPECRNLFSESSRRQLGIDDFSFTPNDQPQVCLMNYSPCRSKVSWSEAHWIASGSELLCCELIDDGNYLAPVKTIDFSRSPDKTGVQAGPFMIPHSREDHKLARSYLLSDESEFLSSIEPSPPPEWQTHCSTPPVNEIHDVGWLDWYAHSYQIFNPPERGVQLGLYAMC